MIHLKDKIWNGEAQKHRVKRKLVERYVGLITSPIEHYPKKTDSTQLRVSPDAICQVLCMAHMLSRCRCCVFPVSHACRANLCKVVVAIKLGQHVLWCPLVP